MSPPVTPGNAAIYFGNFTVGALIAGFDILTSGYNEASTTNATIRPIPWANPVDGSHYAIVVQSGGLEPRTRMYRVIVYYEIDYGALRSLVSQVGVLHTVRETDAPAMLNSVKRGSFQDTTDPAGPQLLDLEFIILN